MSSIIQVSDGEGEGLIGKAVDRCLTDDARTFVSLLESTVRELNCRFEGSVRALLRVIGCRA